MDFEHQQEAMQHLGRPREYNSGEVVDHAKDLFWAKGYDVTSLGDIESIAQVNRSTIYSSFEGKAGLYLAAVDAYVEEIEEELVRPLIEGSRGLEDLAGFVDRLSKRFADSSTPDGCLLVNALGEGDPPEAVSRYFANLRAGFEAALDRAVKLGEVSAVGIDEKVSSLLSSAIGLNVLSKSGAGPEELNRLCRGVQSMVRQW